MGAREVVVVALEAPHEMPAARFEIEEAAKEGIVIRHRLGPKSILGDTGVQGLETLDVASVFDPDGRFNPRFVEGTERQIPCDSVILAIGQAPDLSWLRREDGIETTPRGTVAADPETLATSAPAVFAGGDVVFGPRNLIDAIGNGRKAAASIHRLLGDEEPGPPRYRRALPVVAVDRPVPDYTAVPRVEVPSMPSGRRIGAPEIELGYTEEQARLEAARCLQCFLNIELDTSLCILCGGCVDICPEKCIRILPVEEIDAISAQGPASALILQEDFCIRCGLCVERCPTNALSLDGWSESSTGLREIEPVAS
jgi:NAD-dependent dihydropyrimidine dehydrogenase PreA subunit